MREGRTIQVQISLALERDVARVLAVARQETPILDAPYCLAGSENAHVLAIGRVR